ncbi:MAG: DUF4870 domain-containing protein [Pyrinomonadaceae bacterium]
MQNQKSALGLDANIAGLIGWIIGIVAVVLVFIEKDNKFVRFHAIQSVIYHLGFVVVYIAFSIIVLILSQISSVLGFLGILFIPIWLIWMGGMIFGAIKAYQGSMFKFPIIGNMAEKWSN